MRALILAGGVSRRIAPINIPKPLIPINGRPNICNTIETISNLLGEIVVVIPSTYYDDYSKALASYKGVYLVSNDYSSVTNNVYSLVLGLSSAPTNEGTLILEGDQIYDRESLRTIVDMLGQDDEESKVYTQFRGEGEWRVVTSQGYLKGYEIVEEGQTSSCFTGISFLSRKDIVKYIEVFKLNSKNQFNAMMYWEEPLCIMAQEGLIKARVIRGTKSLAHEYDNPLDLLSILGYDELARLISDPGTLIKRMNESMTNRSYKITWKGKPYILRIPGIGTEKFIDRKREPLVVSQVESILDIPHSEYYSDRGIKLTEYVESKYKALHGPSDIEKVVNVLDQLHISYIFEEQNDSDSRIESHFLDIYRDLFKEIDEYLKMMSKEDLSLIPASLSEKISDLIENGRTTLSLTHGDLIPYNILFDKNDEVKLIDWEYSGYASYYFDYGSYVSEQALLSVKDSSNDETFRKSFIKKVIEFSNKNLDEKLILDWSYLVDYVWALWGFAKTRAGEDYYEYGIMRLNRAKEHFIKNK